ncbi:O-antigen ligase family protein [Maribacter sp. Asnod1-A12]|uniref:O-antigen ligase family protein n=1 Tax=Maribacter sp. Asnod1-A12 TaxID=3160576 RepID=UPI0038704EB3
MLQYIIAFVIILLFLFFFIKKPTVETYVKFTILSLPFTDTKLLPLEYGFVKVFDILALTAFIFLFKEFLTLKNKRTNMTYLVMVVIFISITLFGKFSSSFPDEKLYTLYPIFTIFIFLRYFIKYLYEDFTRRFELVHLLKIGFVVAMVAMFLQMSVSQEITYYSAVHGNARGESISTTRFPGLFADSQTNGQFLAMGSFLFLYGTASIRKVNYLRFLGFICMALCVVLAGSRSALGGLLVGTVLIFLMANLRTKLIIGSLAAITMLIVIVAKPSIAILGRTDNVGEDLSFREAIWEETMLMIEDNPIIGIGLGNYQKYIMTYYQDLNIVIEPGVKYYYFSQPENGYLKILVEHGIIAFVLLFILILRPVFKNFLRLMNHSAMVEVKFVLCSIVAFLVAFTTVYSFLDYRLLSLFGILISLSILHTNYRKSYNHTATQFI